jgi:hypothetical protein
MRRLEVEHMKHGGAENGRLQVTFNQFVEWGVERNRIAPAIRELVALGIVEITERGCAGNERYRRANRFRLTYVNSKSREQPTHEWRKIRTIQEANQLAIEARAEKDSRAADKGRRGARALAEKQNPVRTMRTDTVGTMRTHEADLQSAGCGPLTSVRKMRTTVYISGASGA